LKNPSLGEVYRSVYYQQEALVGTGKHRRKGLRDIGKWIFYGQQ
jgi:hypothetical protein